jgi:mRNA-degrading endonuclease RelE of RelBE toxin-antitoxin system
MSFQITITADAESQLQSLPAFDRRRLEAAIVSRLQHHPTTPTRAIKALRPNRLVQFELRVGDFVCL